MVNPTSFGFPNSSSNGPQTSVSASMEMNGPLDPRPQRGLDVPAAVDGASARVRTLDQTVNEIWEGVPGIAIGRVDVLVTRTYDRSRRMESPERVNRQACTVHVPSGGGQRIAGDDIGDLLTDWRHGTAHRSCPVPTGSGEGSERGDAPCRRVFDGIPPQEKPPA